MPDIRVQQIIQTAQFGSIYLDFNTMEMFRAGQPVKMTFTEFKVLRFLVSRPRVVISRQRLINSVWPKRKRRSYRTVDNCIANLRHKIENDPSSPTFIQTVHGVGYKFFPPNDFYALPRRPAD